MPKPSPDFDLITVEWRAANDRGEAQVGSLRITPNISRALVDPHASTPIGVYLTPRTVTISPTQVTINSVMYNVGFASFQLLASNDPDIFADPSEWFTYTITETLTDGAVGETYNLFVDKDAVGGTINLQAVDRGIPSSTSSSPVSTVTVSAFATLTGRVDALEAASPSTAAAAEVAFTPTGTIASTDVQAAVAEVAADAASALSGHTGAGSGAHAASAVSFSPTGTIAGTDVQGAVAEVATDAATALSGHTGAASGAHAASAISFTPTGTVASTTVQAAIAEVAAEAGGGSGVPWLVEPANGSTDAGPLIQAALDTYGVAWVAAGSWLINSQVLVDNGESVIGQGQGTTRFTIGSSLNNANGVFVLNDGASSHLTLQGFEIDCSSGANAANYGVYMNATTTPTAPDISPDFVNIIRDVSVYGATLDGFYIGGTGAYSGNCRETRLDNCLSKHNGRWGFNIASSDVFLHGCTTHGNGNGFGGYHTESGDAGNAKFVNCKAYYEDIGFDSQAVRVSWYGGEIQDCERAAHLAAYNHFVSTVDSCGDGGTSIGAIRIGGTGCKLDVMFVGRTPPSGANGVSGGSHVLQMQFGASVLNANIAVQAFGGGNDYSTAVYQGTNRPAAGSVVTTVPSTMTT